MAARVVLGKYEVGRFIGRGSMGQVYLAKRRDGRPDVVVKFMHPQVAARPRFREMFASEMQMMARFRHPNAVKLLEGSLDDPVGPCIVMEYVRGVELAQLLNKEGRFSPVRLAGPVLYLCQALNAAHEAGIIHRDLKPANLMISDPGTENELLKVMDLGLASLSFKPYIPVGKLQGSGDAYLVGSPAYMCPEQIRGDDTDARGDLYSLGVLLFEALSGRLPFDDEAIPALLKAHTDRPPPSFAQVGCTDVPPQIEMLVQQLLSKFPNERPKNAMEIAQRYLDAVGFDEPLDPADFSPREAGIGDSPSDSHIPPDGSSVDRIVQSLEAWMPEAVAIVKLRGFLEDLGARVITSEPGLIRVRLGEPPPPPEPPKGLMKWLRRTPPAPASDVQLIEPVAIDLYLTRKPGAKCLEVRSVFRALDGALPDDPRWHRRAKKLFADLKAYLMAQR